MLAAAEHVVTTQRSQASADDLAIASGVHQYLFSSALGDNKRQRYMRGLRLAISEEAIEIIKLGGVSGACGSPTSWGHWSDRGW